MCGLKEINLHNINLSGFRQHYADCVVLTHDNRLLLQRRTLDAPTAPGRLSLFGGHVEEGEKVFAGLRREICEELGAEPPSAQLFFIGAVAEEEMNYEELIHVYFWHDKDGLITGCYEGEAEYYERAEDALGRPEIMEYAAWALKRCLQKDLIL